VKFRQKIIAFTLLLTIFNIVLGKSIHEFFEHDHKAHECKLKGITHFHEMEITHFDFICNFNFSANLIDAVLSDFDEIIRCQDNKVKIHFLWLAKNLCSRTISLRGPPSNL
jgi:competence protein ComGF